MTKASGIKTLADLKGKRVALSRHGRPAAFDRALQTRRHQRHSLQVINLGWNAGKRKTALAASRVDAVWGGVSLLALHGDKLMWSSKAVTLPAAEHHSGRVPRHADVIGGRRRPSRSLTCW